MKRLLMILALIIVNQLIFGYSTGFTIGTWGQTPGSDIMDSGMYFQFGLVRGLTDRIETELFTAVQVTPLPGDAFFAGGGFIAAVAGPREYTDTRTPPYYNALLSAGVLTGKNRLYSEPSSLKTALYVRFAPLALKGPHYGKRERAATTGLMYNLQDRSFTTFWNIMLFDFY